MGLLICQQCGVVLRQRVRACRDCGSPLSRHSPTLMPVLLAGRSTTNTPQALKPEHDTLLVERVVTRCKFNEAMSAKPLRFHGSRAFLEPEGGQEGGAPSTPEGASTPGSGSFVDSGERSVGVPPAPSAPESASTPGCGSPADSGERSAGVPPAPSTPELASIPGSGNPVNSGERSPPALRSESVVGRLRDPANEDFFADTIATQPKSAPTSQPSLQSSTGLSEQKSESAKAPEGSVMDKTKLLRNAPLPSFMVADWLYLVVQESDGKTLSVNHTIEGTELPPVFGLLQGSSDPSICSVQPQPDHTVSLSGSTAFIDADDHVQPSAAPDQSVNIDSRLAFEDGLGRVAAIRLQGALTKSGVVGFEDPENREEFRRKFTRKPNSSAEENAATAEKTVEAVTAEADKQKEESKQTKKSQKGRMGPDKVDSRASEAPKRKNPLAMVGATIGILGVVAVIGFILISKFASSTDSAQSPGGIPLNWHMRLLISEPYQAIFQEFDVAVANDSEAVISGKGTDQLGSYTISGEVVEGVKLSLQKQYDQGYEWPIMFSGRMEKGQNGSFATGTFVWRRSNSERIEGTWDASKLQSGWLPIVDGIEQLAPTDRNRSEDRTDSNRLSAASDES
ncbi:MAG: hypothetical protein K2X93_10205 [Candidatus Obscuribacterales bacterium]|nr:hypothetical protein [Candidatus Obscuribacterales bacterium]